jgi:hypothetical protein
VTFTALILGGPTSWPVFFLKCLRIDPIDYPERIKRQLAETLAGYKDMLARLEPSGDAKKIAAVRDVIKVYERKYEHFASVVRN